MQCLLRLRQSVLNISTSELVQMWYTHNEVELALMVVRPQSFQVGPDIVEVREEAKEVEEQIIF